MKTTSHVNPRRLMPFKAFCGLLAVCMSASDLSGQVPEHLMTTDVIDFSHDGGMGYVHHGYRITAPPNDWIRLSSGGGIRANNGGFYLSVATAVPITLVHADGLPFEILSLDIAEYSTVAIPSHVDFEGLKSDGSQVTFRFIPDAVIDGDGPLNDFQTVHFPEGWSDIVSLQMLNGKVALDNIAVRGFSLDGFHVGDVSNPPLEVLGVLENSASYNQWRILSCKNGGVGLSRQRYYDDPEYFFRFDLNNKVLQYRGTYTNNSGENPDTLERAYLKNGALIWQLGPQTVELARIGEGGVVGIELPKPAGGKVLFLNAAEENHGNPSVMIAGPSGVQSILHSQTVLPDGGLPESITGEFTYTGTSYSIRSATTKSTQRYIISFAGGPLRLSPGDGDSIPGTSLKIIGCPTLRWLNDNTAGFVANSGGGNSELLQIVMTADGTWTTTIRTVPAWGSQTVLPGAGFLLRSQSVAIFDEDPALIGYGPIECSDLAPNNIYGLVAELADGSRHLLVRSGRQIPGFGQVLLISPQALIQNDWFFVVVSNTAGVTALLKGRIPSEEPRLKAGAFVPTSDGTVRFMVENLTHGQSYRVERADSPAGPWSAVSKFTAGSPVRSVHAEFEQGQRGFFRVGEISE